MSSQPDDLSTTSEQITLPRARPADHGLDAAGVEAFLDAIGADPALELHSLMILRHGQVLAEGWWAPYQAGDAGQLYSLSKSFTSTAAGFAVAEGLLALDEPALDVFPRYTAVVTDERVRRLTIGDCLRMATGHREDTLERVYASDRDDPLRGFFALPLDAEPGSLFCYNNTATYLVAAAVQERSGQQLTDYLMPRLFEPLGIERPYWQAHPAERQIGFAGLHLNTEAIARFGQVCLDRGRWQGRSVLPTGWIEQAARPLTDNSREENIDWAQGYGYQFWMARHGYRGDGAFGQFCLVLPDQDTVIAMTSQTEQMQSVLDLVWEHLLPALGAPAADQPTDDQTVEDRSSEPDDRLAERLRALALPRPGDQNTGNAQPVELPTSWRLTRAGEDVQHPPLRAVTVELDDPSRPSGTVRIEHDVPGAPAGTPPLGYTFRFADDWTRDEFDVAERRLRYAAAAGWHSTGPDDRTLTIEVAFLNSPHRLAITLTVNTGDDAGSDTGEAEVRWVIAPLGVSVPLQVAVPLTF